MARGRELVQRSGCLNCHQLALENLFPKRSLAQIGADRWDTGCLAETPSGSNPRFVLSGAEREALRAFGKTGAPSLTRHVRSDFTEREIRRLNCARCHGKLEGFPPLELLGEKLQPEWIKRFLAGEVPQKPRPWLEQRMPVFAPVAKDLAEGMSMLHGFPPTTPAEAPANEEMAKIGQQLVSANGGFSCISCHGIGAMAASQVFESAGPNFAFSAQRLRKSYFQRWVRNPLAIDPATKMPVYFDEEGKSPLPDIFEGNGLKQMEAIWQYLRQGDKMVPPPVN